MHRLGRTLLIGTIIGIALATSIGTREASAQSLSLTFHIVADQDTIIPGSLAAGTFADFGTWAGIDEQENVVFCGLGGLDSNGQTQAGMYVANGIVTVVADKNTLIPGTSDSFTAFGNGTCTGKHAIDDGRIVFMATAPGSVFGIYTDAAGTLERVANADNIVGSFSSISYPSLDGTSVSFRGARVLPGLTTEPQVILFDSVTDTATILGVADPACPNCGVSGHVNPALLGTSVVVNRGTTGVTETVVVNGAVEVVMSSSVTPVPGKPGVVFTSPPNFPVFDENGNVGFVPVVSDGARGAYKRVGGVVYLVADDLTPIPDGPLGSATTFPFNGINDGNLGIANGSAAFMGFGGGGTRGIYTDLGGTLTKIVATGDTILVDGIPYSPSFLEFGPEGFSQTGPNTYSLVFFARAALPFPLPAIIRTDITLAPPRADLDVTLADNPDPIVVGETVAYEATVTNNGPDTALDVALTETFPAGGVVESTDTTQGTCNANGDEVICSLGDVPPDDEVVVTVLVQAPDAGVLVNETEVSSATEDDDLTNNQAVEDTVVNSTPEPEADLEVSKVDAIDPVNVGNTIRYTVTVRNLGPDPAENVSLVDTLAPGTNLDSVDPGPRGACSAEDNVVTCLFGDLDPGEEAVVTIGVVATAEGELTNVADVTSDTLDPQIENNQASEQTTVLPAPAPEADLRVSLSDAPDPVALGDRLTYVVTVSNGGPDTASDVTLVDRLSAAVSWVSADASQGSCDLLAGDVVCSLGEIASGGSAELRIQVDTLEVGLVSNEATVSSATDDPEPTNNQAIERTTVEPPPEPTADLEVAKVDAVDPVYVGDSILYTVTVRNHGPDAAENATVVDTLPAGVLPVSADPSGGGSCILDGNVITCTFGELEPGAQAAVTIVAEATEDGEITNVADVASVTEDPEPANNRAIEPTTVFAEREEIADLRVRISDDPDPVAVGERVTYTMTVANAGPDDAGDVVVRASVTGPAEIADPGACEYLQPELVCRLGTVAPDSEAAARIVVEATGTGILVARVSAETSTNEDNLADNTVSESTVARRPTADVSIDIGEGADPVPAGGTFVYELTVRNEGPHTARNVRVTNRLLGPIADANVDPTQGSCEQRRANPPLHRCSLGDIEPGASAIIAVVVRARDVRRNRSILEIATVVSDTLDLSLLNNVAAETTRVVGGS